MKPRPWVHPSGLAYDLTLTSSDDSDFEVWNTPDPAAGATPLLGDGISSVTIDAGPNQMSDGLYISGLDDTTDLAGQISEMLIMSGQLVSNTSGLPSPVGPSQPVVSNPVTDLALALQVATINDGDAVAGSFLSTADMHGAGAFVPLDNNDWNYDLTPDLQGSGAVPGDKYLLPITLQAYANATAGSYYTLSSSGSIRAWQGADRTGLVLFGSNAGPTRFPANVATPLYIEGVGDTTAGSPAMLYLNYVDVKNGVTHAHVAWCNITVFTMTGALDVPGGGTYTYSSDLHNGSTWAAPTGGAAYQFTSPLDLDRLDVVTWENTAEFGEANFQANSNYTWSCQVNVVQLGVGIPNVPSTNAIAYPNPNTPTQLAGLEGAAHNYEVVHSGTVGFAAQVQMFGKSVGGGPQRGIQYIQVGAIQNIQFTYEEAQFGPAPQVRYWNKQGASWYLDADYGYYGHLLKAPNPWYPMVTATSGASFRATTSAAWSPPTSSFLTPVITFDDDPQGQPTDMWGWGVIQYPPAYVQSAYYFDLVSQFHTFIVAQTNYSSGAGGVNGSENVYTGIGEAHWTFNGSGPVVASSKTWTPGPTAGTRGDASFGTVRDSIVTSGDLANSFYVKPYYWGT